MPEKLKKPELPPNVVKIETKEGIFRIAYGLHNISQKPEDVKGTDAIMLETGSFGYHSSPEEAIKIFHILSNPYEFFKQYQKIIEKAAQNNQPIYFADIDMDVVSTELISALRVSENIMDAYLILSSLYQLAYKIVTSGRKKMNRRDFLKLLSKSLLAVYFAPQLAEDLILFLSLPDKAMLNEEAVRRKIHRFLIKLNEKIHPETNMILITLRNIIMAQKLITIAQDINKEISKKPEIGVVVGASHIGIEEALNLDEKERNEIIEKIMNFAKGVKKNIATIARFDYDSKTERWELTKFYKDPFLASLET